MTWDVRVRVHNLKHCVASSSPFGSHSLSQSTISSKVLTILELKLRIRASLLQKMYQLFTKTKMSPTRFLERLVLLGFLISEIYRKKCTISIEQILIS